MLQWLCLLNSAPGNIYDGMILFIFVLRQVQQPGSYCDREFTGGATSAY